MILRGVERNKRMLVFPFSARLVWWLHRVQPWPSPLEKWALETFRAARKRRLDAKHPGLPCLAVMQSSSSEQPPQTLRRDEFLGFGETRPESETRHWRAPKCGAHSTNRALPHRAFSATAAPVFFARASCAHLSPGFKPRMVVSSLRSAVASPCFL